eukprot:2892220-Prymnesium_polylepis.1
MRARGVRKRGKDAHACCVVGACGDVHDRALRKPSCSLGSRTLANPGFGIWVPTVGRSWMVCEPCTALLANDGPIQHDRTDYSYTADLPGGAPAPWPCPL